jgi:hypothetical protein
MSSSILDMVFENKENSPAFTALKQEITDNVLFMTALKKAGYEQYLKLKLEQSTQKVKAFSEATTGAHPMPEHIAENFIKLAFEESDKSLKELLTTVMDSPWVTAAVKKINESKNTTN